MEQPLRALRERDLTDVKPTVWVFFGQEKYIGEIAHVSDDYDFSILRIGRHGRPYFRLACADKFARGTRVTACGFPGVASGALSEEEQAQEAFRHSRKHRLVEKAFKPRDFEFVMTRGTVSRLSKEDGTGRCWIQHDAKIHHGNSGGPLVDERGIVLGINTLGIGDAKEGVVYYSLSVAQLKGEVHRFVPQAKWE